MQTEMGGGPGVTVNFTLMRDYFKDVNKALTGQGWGQPDMCDLDQDGDLDLVLNYIDKNGTTAFINHGTSQNPIWKEDKRIFSNSRPETNLKFQNLTDTRILETGTGTTLDLYSNRARAARRAQGPWLRKPWAGHTAIRTNRCRRPHFRAPRPCA